DRSNSVGDVPAFITRRTATDIQMRDGQTLVMSGLIDRDAGKSIEKIPYLRDIPIIGALFRPTNFHDNRTELVIFVTPTVFDAESEFNKQKIERRNQMVETFKANAKYEEFILD